MHFVGKTVGKQAFSYIVDGNARQGWREKELAMSKTYMYVCSSNQ